MESEEQQDASISAMEWNKAERLIDNTKLNGKLETLMTSALHELEEETELSYTNVVIMSMTNFVAWQDSAAYKRLRLYIFSCASKHGISTESLLGLDVHPYQHHWKKFLQHASQTEEPAEEFRGFDTRPINC